MPSNQFHRIEKLIGNLPAVASVGSGDAPSFSGTWANAGGTLATLGFYKDPYGTVHLKGSVDTGTSGTVIFTLPAGYRPSEELHFPAGVGALYGGGANYIKIATNGEVTGYYGTSTLHLNGVSFRV